jgi:uncharacterized protein (TIGR03546 family)
MLVFFIKQMLSLKKAILGRREPHQLAWGLALGLLLGMVPHGNLIAFAILLFIMSVGVNHGMVAVTAVITSVLASRLDTQTHAVGNYLLTHPDFSPMLASAWQLPVVPWTDINNTVVMGSLAVGLAFVVPAYLFTYPIFHWLAPEPIDVPTDVLPPPNTATAIDTAPQTLKLHSVDDSNDRITADEIAVSGAVLAVSDSDSKLVSEASHSGPGPVFLPLMNVETIAIDAAFGQAAQAEELAKRTIVDTRIEVVRMYPIGQSASDAAQSKDALPLAELEQVARETSEQDPPMSEALNYLLRQLRDARQGRAA